MAQASDSYIKATLLVNSEQMVVLTAASLGKLQQELTNGLQDVRSHLVKFFMIKDKEWPVFMYFTTPALTDALSNL